MKDELIRQANAGNYYSYLSAILLLAGLYFPTSIDGTLSHSLSVRAVVVLLGLYALLIIAAGSGRFRLILIGLCIPVVLVISTFFSPFYMYELGGIYIYCLLGFLYALNLRGIRSSALATAAFVGANIINIILGLGIIFSSEYVSRYINGYYTDFYPELLPAMLALRKPVLTFGAHSIAGFFLFLFFWMNLASYERLKKPFYLWFAVIYTVFSAFLFSFTALFFFTLEMAFLIRILLQKGWKVTLGVVLVPLAAAAIIFSSVGSIGEDWKYNLLEYSTSFLSSTDNGLIGRYSSSGVLAPNLAYFRDHPLTPVGLSNPSTLVFVDSGPLVYLLRGSYPLMLLIYVGLFLFLKQNLLNKRHFIVLFGAIAVFEVGFSILTYVRMLYLLPFVIIYLNGLQSTTLDQRVPFAARND
jgi:hypothetical protein